jgi:hypothetical protein
MRRLAVSGLLLGLLWSLPGCAALQQLRAIVQPPRFEESPDHRHEVALLGPAVSRPLGGARIRLWTRVTNPNGFGFTLGTLRGTLFLEGTSAATADFPLGLPLEPRASSTIPIDLIVSFADVPGLADVVRRAVRNEPVTYRFDGTIGVDAGRYGTPTFGPMTLLAGTFR